MKQAPDWKVAAAKERNRLNNEMRAMRSSAFKERLEDQIRREIHIKQIEAKGRTMVKSVSADFYASRAWRELRYHALIRSSGKCECCGRGSHSGIVLHVDHIKPRSKFPELSLSLSNLQVLCDDCNIGKSNKDDTDWRDLSPRTYYEDGKKIVRIKR